LAWQSGCSMRQCRVKDFVIRRRLDEVNGARLAGSTHPEECYPLSKVQVVANIPDWSRKDIDETLKTYRGVPTFFGWWAGPVGDDTAGGHI